MTWLLSHRQRLRSLKWKKWKSRRWLQLCCSWDFMITQVLFGKHLQKLQPNTLSPTCSSAMTYQEDLKEEPQVPGVVEALALCFFSSSQPFPPQHPKYMKLWQAEQSERFPVLDLPGNKKCWSQRLWEDFFSQAKFHLVRWRCLWLTDLWALGKRCCVLTCLNGVRSPLKMLRRCQWLSRPSLSGTFFGVLFENWEKHDKLTNDSWSLKILEA